MPGAVADRVRSVEGIEQDARSFEQLLEQTKDNGSSSVPNEHSRSRDVDARLVHDKRNEFSSAKDPSENSMGIQPMPDGFAAFASIASVSSAASASVLSSIDTIRRIDQLVEFLAVSTPADGAQKVVLKLSPDILPDTTVSLHVTGGMLEVAFNYGPDAPRLPSDINFQALAERLAACSGGMDVRIIAPVASGFEPAAYLAFGSKHSSKRDEKERDA